MGGFDYSPHFFDDTYDVDFKESYNDSIKYSFPKDSEVYVRWLQVGVFSSHLRAHGKQAREPWTYGDEVEHISLKYLKLRYRLIPYIYSQAVNCTQNGLPMVRPMLLEFQDDRNTQKLDLQYMFGESFLVAPVLTRDHQVDVYLPQGVWVDYWTKQRVEGGQWLKVVAPLECLPLWVRGGSIIPYGPDKDFVEQKSENELTLEIYAPHEAGQTTIYDEDIVETMVSYQRLNAELILKIDKFSGIGRVRLFDVNIETAQQENKNLVLGTCENGFEVNFYADQATTIKFCLKRSENG